MKNQILPRIAYTLVFTFIFHFAQSQNLVRNPGFENVLAPSCNLTMDSAHFSSMVQDWALATQGTADLRTTLVGQNCLTHCTSTHDKVHGRQPPYEGNVMVGLYTFSYSGGGDYREYVEVELQSAMQVGETYYCEMHVSRAENFAMSSNNIGMYFSDQRVYQGNYQFINVTPQINYDKVITDTNGWVKVSGEIVATSPLKFLTIGNFFSNADTKTELLPDPTGKSSAAYYFVDVVIVRKGKARQVIDTVMCEGDTIELDAGNNTAIAWAKKENPDSTISTSNILRVSPQTEQNYILFGQEDTVEYHVAVNPAAPQIDLGADTLNICAGEVISKSFDFENVDYLWQDGSTQADYEIREPGKYWVEVSNSCGENSDTLVAIDEGCECIVFVPNVFTPNTDSLNEFFAPDISCDPEEYHLQIYNRWGEMLFESFQYENTWSGTYRGVPVPEGVYFWILNVTDDQSGLRQRIPLSGTVTVLR